MSPSISYERSEEAHERGGPSVEAVDDAEGECAEAEFEGQVERQDSDDHLLGQVGEETDKSQQDDVRADAPGGPGTSRTRVDLWPIAQ